MKYITLGLATAGLLLQAVGAQAIQFSQPRLVETTTGETATEEGTRWTVSLQAAWWNLPSAAGVSTDAEVRPLVAVEYQATPRIAVGGWYNPVAVEAKAHDASGNTAKATLDGSIFEIHGTYNLPMGFAAQLGYQRQDASGDLSFNGVNLAHFDSSVNYITLWGLKGFDFRKGEPKGFSLLAGLGVQFPLDSGADTIFGGQVGGSYSFNRNWSVDASLWLPDFGDTDTTRVSAGGSYHF